MRAGTLPPPPSNANPVVNTDGPTLVALARWALALSLPVIAACSSPVGPAPVVHRDAAPAARAVVTQRDVAVPPPPVVAAPPPVVAAPAAPPAASPAGGRSVESAPVRVSRLESRPLENRGTEPPAETPGAADIRSASPATTLEPPAPVMPPPPAAAAAPSPAGTVPPPPPAVAVSPGTRPAAPPAPPPAVAMAPRSTESRQARFIWPADGAITKHFGDPKSLGIAIAGRRGDPVAAAADGKVIFSGLGPKGYGKLLIVKHQDDLLSVYANNSNLLVREGQQVRQGQKIAELGTAGDGKDGLHFEIRRQGKPVDPLPYLPDR